MSNEMDPNAPVEGEEIKLPDDVEYTIRSPRPELPISVYHDGKPLIVWDPDKQTLAVCGTIWALSFFEAFGQEGSRGQFSETDVCRIVDRGDGVVTVQSEKTDPEMRDLCKRMYETLLDFTPSVGGIALQDYGRFNEVMMAGAGLFPETPRIEGSRRSRR